MEKEDEKKTEVYESYVVVHNIAKRHNVGTLARSATAFGVSELILVGRRDFNAFGSHGSTSHMRFRHFHTLSLARNYLKEKDCDICGVEITDNAVPVNTHPFRKSTAFLVGNEGTGLSPKECEMCDFFVYIPQYGGGTASLNVTVAASIVLQHFAEIFFQFGQDSLKELVKGTSLLWPINLL
ncbi:putative TrmH family tRNA/rRNA methyltransferase isoform X2 [Salvia splendens]|uniref:putative TrmH family tRNA/rRNA methyltransferase isoform X2 n=1 Tax=Salvia splendens TaxID=180675 RepID=UPI001C27BE51|nr:putative TrmH family tRNA/rRNA methyltransferase isoform X2 [Salvia splendens]